MYMKNIHIYICILCIHIHIFSTVLLAQGAAVIQNKTCRGNILNRRRSELVCIWDVSAQRASNHRVRDALGATLKHVNINVI